MPSDKNKIIKISCKGQKYVDINSLENFQGNLKILSDLDRAKLRNSILKHGFAFPVFVWNTFIIDGHNRVDETKNLLLEGYTIGKIPIVEIDAENRSEAAEKLLVLNSDYAKISVEGMLAFLSDFEINPDLEVIEIGSIDFGEILDAETITELLNIPELEGEAKDKKRNLGKKKYQIKPVLYTNNVDVFERAILATGEQKYASGLIKICEFYLESKNVKVS